jgi:hypothetical protein
LYPGIFSSECFNRKGENELTAVFCTEAPTQLELIEAEAAEASRTREMKGLESMVGILAVVQVVG